MHKKDEQKTELYKTLWNIADSLRGSVDGWDFKQYVLGFLFYRYISEYLNNQINKYQASAGLVDFDYSQFDDESAQKVKVNIVNDYGFFMKPSQLFQNVVKRANRDKSSEISLNEEIKQIFNDIEESSKLGNSYKDFEGLFDDIDLNSNKLASTVVERNKLITDILNAIADMKLGGYHDNDIDVFGDAYEYLMGMYAQNAGKSGGEYFTPQEVSELLARLTTIGKKEVKSVYDPACGSGSLLLKFAKILGKDNVSNFYGQEINPTTYNLCRINMFLHGISYEKFSIAKANTLTNPQHRDKEPFEAIVSNPPYSTKWEGESNPLLIQDDRFAPAGVLAPVSKADLAFTMHILSSLAPNGTAAIVEFPGVLYRGGNEAKIRQYLVQNNFIDAVIQLPANMFYGPTIATCIIVLKKNKTTHDIAFIDASEQFVKGDKKKKLSEENINYILDLYKNRQNVDNLVAVIPNEKVLQNDANLSINKYVTSNVVEEEIDIKELNEQIAKCVAKQNELRKQIDQIISEIEGTK
ncbi:type I restriction-modification system subunit M [Mycoplasmopsis verecunda]|uniref:site-specific DNA-methyltransferase (adenine-specific) n=1 Tax=Mycoplasmopsis verecunda TaxID=171291 RepID=A0A1T4LQE8_9BACT|nr:type I restriction-modification system subunit M [Mycoplasmopsis verecunda]WPB54550.1 type I restriction-modification system subunit M [Mycoplasmopsis verecunda]SJZ56871.1 type I restriction enzyme M protein [Mycoplasmopsis verecunda]